MDKVRYQEFKEFLLIEIQKNFPHIELFIVSNGDHVSDLIMEARNDNKRIKFAPYELWKTGDYEKNVFQLLNDINNIL